MKFQPINQFTEAGQNGRKLTLAWSATEGVQAKLRVAFATDDHAVVNQHFGASERFAVFAIDSERARLVEVIHFSAGSSEGRGDESGNAQSHHRLTEKIASLAGCSAVYCLAVGGSAVSQLLAEGIQPVRLESETPIDTLLEKLRIAIRDGGVSWIDRVVRRANDSSRFERMAEEGWQE